MGDIGYIISEILTGLGKIAIALVALACIPCVWCVHPALGILVAVFAVPAAIDIFRHFFD